MSEILGKRKMYSVGIYPNHRKNCTVILSSFSRTNNNININSNQLVFSTVVPACVLLPVALSLVTESTLKTKTKGLLFRANEGTNGFAFGFTRAFDVDVEGF